VWALDLDDVIEIAEGELTRGLTRRTAGQYLHLRRARNLPRSGALSATWGAG
jgi:hypothetical protein